MAGFYIYKFSSEIYEHLTTKRVEFLDGSPNGMVPCDVTMLGTFC